MLFIFNKLISSKKKLSISLQKIYGINQVKSLLICHNFGINPNSTLSDLPEKKIKKLSLFIQNITNIEERLRQNNYKIFNQLLEIKSYKGLRHTYGLPTNGQRTHTNRKTARKLKNKWVKK